MLLRETRGTWARAEENGLSRWIAAIALLGLVACPSADAADLPSLPSLAQDPQLPPPSVWKGFYVGTGVSASVSKGAKGAFGGDVFAGYDHTFENGVVLGVKFDTGYNPWLSSYGKYRGFDFAETDVKVGYEMGKFTPYVMTGVAIAKGTNFGSPLPDANASLNGLLGGPGGISAVGVAGVGVDYAVTNNLHVGVAAFINGANGH